MARKPTERQLYEELLTRYGREIADAFMQAVDDLRRTADLQRVIAAVAARDLSAAMAALHLDAAAFNALLASVQAAYAAGGTAAVAYIPAFQALGAAVVVRFDVRAPRAEAWLRDRSSTLITRIVDDQRAAVRQALTAGMARGENPKTTALDIVGRINRATGKREGGIVGLTAAQEAFARSAGLELRSGDPDLLRHYLTRQRRDRRYDRAVARAIREGKPVPGAVAANAERAYRNRLLKLRGETIGRNEALTALRGSKREAYLQAVDKGLPEGSITRTWDAVGDRRTRHTHSIMDGQKVTGLVAPFRSPSGALLLFPGDTSLGAGPSEIIGCRCDVRYRINHLANLR